MVKVVFGGLFDGIVFGYSGRDKMCRFFLRSLCIFTLTGLVATVAWPLNHALAADITWGGNYRVEGVLIKNPELIGDGSNKAYILHHLMLAPRIVAGDGLTIHSRLDVLNNEGTSISPNGSVYSVAGDVIGNGPGNGIPATPPTTTDNQSNALGRTQRATPLHITALYGSWIHEFGQLVVGRAPLHFGLGMNYNAGNGLFDHFIDTRDMVGYKVVLGNLFFMPMIGKVNEGNVGEEDDVNDYMVHVQYENPETELVLGFFYQMRIGTFPGNDTPITSPIGSGDAPAAGQEPTRADGFKHTTMGLHTSQRVQDFRISFEGSMVSGETGLTLGAGGRAVSIDAFGLAAEVAWMPTDSKLSGLLRAGIASGDEAGTPEKFEGFAFNRNYDVGMLMFNHPLGVDNSDLLRTGAIRPAALTRNQIDMEAISNAVYIAPSLQYQTRDNFSWGGTFIYGILNSAPSGASSNLGYEIDLNVTYRPFERFTWITEAGFLLPGEAWAAPTGGDNKFSYGVITKAAINF